MLRVSAKLTHERKRKNPNEKIRKLNPTTFGKAGIWSGRVHSGSVASSQWTKTNECNLPH